MAKKRSIEELQSALDATGNTWTPSARAQEQTDAPAPVTPEASPIPAVTPERPRSTWRRAKTRANNLVVSASLPPKYQLGLKDLATAQTTARKRVFTQDLLAEALDDLFRKYRHSPREE